jgi:hypothetical protein
VLAEITSPGPVEMVASVPCTTVNRLGANSNHEDRASDEGSHSRPRVTARPTAYAQVSQLGVTYASTGLRLTQKLRAIGQKANKGFP